MKFTHKLLLGSSVTSFAKAGTCPFGYTSSDSSAVSGGRQLSDSEYPSELFQCDAGAIQKTVDFTVDDYEAIVESVHEKYLEVSDEASDNSNPRADFVGCLVRLAGHDFMDYRVGGTEGFAGGSDGCINFNDADNTGLATCVSTTGVLAIYENWCSKVSLADFIVIIAEAAIGQTATDADATAPFTSGTFQAKLRDKFAYGRTTVDECSWNSGLMPNPEDGCPGLSNIFVDHIYQSRIDPWTMTAAISGAHTVGSAKLSNSGYSGWWSDVDSAGKFNNDYYRSLVAKGWGHEREVGGNAAKNQWERVDLGHDAAHHEIMLRSDLCLAYDTNPDQIQCRVENGCLIVHDCDECKYLLDAEQTTIDLELTTFSADGASFKDTCCAWVSRSSFWTDTDNWDDLYDNDFCGITSFGDEDKNIANRADCCGFEGEDSYGDCDDPSRPGGPAYYALYDWIYEEKLWVDYYVIAWNLATTNGYESLSFIVEQDAAAFAVDTDVATDCESLARNACYSHWACDYLPVSSYEKDNGTVSYEYGCKHIQNYYYY